jgi:hypothetical protein
MVFNFVDMISHARTEMDMIRELANDENAYRSLTLSWFNHSSFLNLYVTLHHIKSGWLLLQIMEPSGLIILLK